MLTSKVFRMKMNTEYNDVLKNVLEIVGGKWAIPIIFRLLDGTKRFKELERSIPNINTRMLVKELKNLESANVVKREAYATVPLTVEYSLTPNGRKLESVIKELHKWGVESIEK